MKISAQFYLCVRLKPPQHGFCVLLHLSEVILTLVPRLVSPPCARFRPAWSIFLHLREQRNCLTRDTVRCRPR